MNQTLRRDLFFLSGLVLLTAVLFGFRLGSFGLLDPDEPFYSLTAREMLQRGDAFTPALFGQPQFEKPIFTYWVLYVSFKLFGVTEFAARLGPCLAGILTVCITYLWGRVLFKRPPIAFISAVILATATEFIILSRIVLTDMFLCLFVTAALFCFSLGCANEKRRKTAWAFIFLFCGLGFATKGPLGILLPLFGIASYFIFSGKKGLWKEMPWGAGIVLFALSGLPWYVFMTFQYGSDFLEHFFVHENIRRFFVAEHRGSDRLHFYPAAVFFGFFPWSVLVPGALVNAAKNGIKNQTRNQKALLYLFLSFILSLIFFMNAKSKLLSYIFPAFPIVALMLGAWAYKFYRAATHSRKLAPAFLSLCILMLGVFPVALAVGTVLYDRANNIGAESMVFVTGVFLTLFCWSALLGIWKRHYSWAFASAGAAMLSFSCLGFGWFLPNADAVFSSRHVVGLYAQLTHPSNSNFILSSKLFVRGVSYYTGDSRVGVFIENPKRAFYTQHPIPIFSSLDDLLSIEKSEFPVYCFFRQKELKVLQKIIDERFSATILKTDAEKVLVRLDRLDIPK